MRVEVLSAERNSEFKNFCLRNIRAVPDGELLLRGAVNDFVLGPNNPTYVVIDEEDNVIAAASLVIRDNGKSGKITEFRIFHSEVCDPQCYELIIKAILTPDTNSLTQRN